MDFGRELYKYQTACFDNNRARVKYWIRKLTTGTSRRQRNYFGSNLNALVEDHIISPFQSALERIGSVLRKAGSSVIQPGGQTPAFNPGSVSAGGLALKWECLVEEHWYMTVQRLVCSALEDKKHILLIDNPILWDDKNMALHIAVVCGEERCVTFVVE